MTLRELLTIGTNLLKEQGNEDAITESEQLLCHLLHKDRIYLYAYGREPADEMLCQSFFDLLRRRTGGTPLQYILGGTVFMGIPLTVNESVLIPRQDTELLAEEALKELSRLTRFLKHHKVLDLCTGSGALAIALAKLDHNVRVTATDLSSEALEVARKNAEAAGVADAIRFCRGDLFEAVKGQGPFELILSNPPYIASDVIDTLAVEIRDHEPRMALDGGADGLDLIRRILKDAPDHLKPGGLLLMEIGYDQGPAVQALVSAMGVPFVRSRILRDLGGNDRVLKARKPR
ncbi:MAG: peptide chain release factor N(5)-glutamine methyltransferase [Bacillota bacterium]|jgi:release factor glutamine methyltransferase|nr:peptide chain release factor N(5)-glutamine methyltransferase [Eubacteriales bacterium]MDI9492555.1 peptide chain release factor N(5)-glutamine methyltransferase [Bacillota bacterium]NLV69639.1 peptide chain release factor N(5)-glutamine methyltransferase [Clostridiales bacterium]